MARGFRDQFSAAQLRAMQKAAGRIKERAYTFVSNVVDDTPVDTGELKGGWQMVKDGSAPDMNTPLDPTGERTKRMLITKIRYLPIHMDWHFTFGNWKPYAYRIEYEGYSNQAPGGMLRKNIARGGEAFEKFETGGKK